MKIMKLFLVIIFASFLTLQIFAQANGKLSNSVNRFSLSLYHEIVKDNSSNIVFSPTGITNAFAQVYIGSNNETREEISNVLGFNDTMAVFKNKYAQYLMSLFRPVSDSSIVLLNANSIWLDKKFSLMPDFRNDSKTYFNSEVFQVNFSNKAQATEKINLWADSCTKHKINKIIDKDKITDETAFIVLNAVYFKDKWKNQFHKENTRDDDFFLSQSEKIKTKMMFNEAQFGYGAYDNFKGILLPYKTKNYSMLILLPDDIEGLPELEQRIVNLNVEEILNNIHFRQVELFMPKFKFQYGLSDLKTNLMELGIKKAFQKDSADFKNILALSSEQNVFLEDVLQKAFIEVNEEGTEAAAVTTIFGGNVADSVPPPPLVIKIDHPFLFFIIENTTKSIMFMGRCMNPLD